MGQQSQHRRKGLRALRHRSRRSRYSTRKKKLPTRRQEAFLLQELFDMVKSKQTTLGFSSRPPPPTVANGGVVCQQCRLGPVCHRGHHPTCPKSQNYAKNKEDLMKEKNKKDPPPITYTMSSRKDRNDFLSGRTMARQREERQRENSMTNQIESRKVQDPWKVPDEAPEPIESEEEESDIGEESVDIFADVCSPNQDEEERSADVAAEKIPPINIADSKKLEIYESMRAPALKAALKERLEQNKENPSTNNIKAKCCIPIYEVGRHILDMFPSKFEKKSNKMLGGDDNDNKMKWYQTHFPPGTTSFEIPRDNCLLEPYQPYSSIVGTKFYFLRWELQDPTIDLKCTKKDCLRSLVHNRFDLSKNGSMTPLLCCADRPGWVVSMRYCCNTCGHTVSAKDGELLCQLPHWMQASYPVRPQYATTKQFHLSNHASDLLERLMLTYGNGPMTAKYMYEKLGKTYVTAETVYYSQAKQAGVTVGSPLLSFQDWVGDLSFLPTGEQLRDLADAAAKSHFTLTGLSSDERHTREIQSVGCDDIFCFDHTHNTANNYPASLGKDNSVWDVSVKTGEVAAAVLVPSTGLADFAHAAECLARRENWDPKVFYSDLWPANEEFWKLILPDVLGRLGLYHFINRIYKTLRDRHIDFAKAVLELRACIYHLVPQDEADLLTALKEGTLNGKCHSESQIREMKLTKQWKRLTQRYCRKVIYPQAKIVTNLDDCLINTR